MIKAVTLEENRNRVNFGKKAEDKPATRPSSDILPNTLSTRLNQKFHKTANAFIEYPAKGLRGDVNSDFYEFLAMGIVPNLIGSGMFMMLFNLVNNNALSPKSRKFAGLNGKQMALGVVMYALFKTLSADLVTRPVYWGTGVDIELPVEHVYNPLPTEAGADAEIVPQIQQRKVFDSREFFRKDLIMHHPDYGTKYYDKVAKKLGLGENLNDSATETTPIIQSIVSMTKTAKSLSTYAWAGLGVGLAVQNSWGDFFDAISNRKRHVPKEGEGFAAKMGARFKNAGHNFVDISKTFGKSFVKSCKTLWSGEANTSGWKHAGKAWILFTAALTAGTTANAIIRAKRMAKASGGDVIDKTKESTVI